MHIKFLNAGWETVKKAFLKERGILKVPLLRVIIGFWLMLSGDGKVWFVRVFSFEMGDGLGVDKVWSFE